MASTLVRNYAIMDKTKIADNEWGGNPYVEAKDTAVYSDDGTKVLVKWEVTQADDEETQAPQKVKDEIATVYKNTYTKDGEGVITGKSKTSQSGVRSDLVSNGFTIIAED